MNKASVHNNKMRQLVFGLILGIPLFFVPECFNIYPLCGDGNSIFQLKITLALFGMVFMMLRLVKFSFTNEILFVATIFFIFVIISLVKQSIYSLVLLISVTPFLVAWFNVRPQNNGALWYREFLFAAFIGSISSIIVFFIFGMDQYEASLVLYSYLNYWNDYVILLWVVAAVLFTRSSYCNGHTLGVMFNLVFLSISVSTLLSVSRSSLVFLFFVFIGFANLMQFKWKSIVFLIIPSLIIFYFSDRFQEKLLSIMYGDPFSGRGSIWLSGLSDLYNYPFFGVPSVAISSHHSTVLDILVSFGLSSIFIFFVIALSVYKILNRAQSAPLLFSIVGFFLGPLSFNEPLRQLNIFLLFTILIAISVCRPKLEL